MRKPGYDAVLLYTETGRFDPEALKWLLKMIPEKATILPISQFMSAAFDNEEFEWEGCIGFICGEDLLEKSYDDDDPSIAFNPDDISKDEEYLRRGENSGEFIYFPYEDGSEYLICVKNGEKWVEE